MWSQKLFRHNFPFPQILHKVFNSDHIWVASYRCAIIRFLRLRDSPGVDHCYFMRHAVRWISSFQTNISLTKDKQDPEFTVSYASVTCWFLNPETSVLSLGWTCNNRGDERNVRNERKKRCHVHKYDTLAPSGSNNENHITICRHYSRLLVVSEYCIAVYFYKLFVMLRGYKLIELTLDVMDVVWVFIRNNASCWKCMIMCSFILSSSQIFSHLQWKKTL